MSLQIGVKKGLVFFDRPAVTSSLDKATRRVFARYGAGVRTIARRSIRKRRRPSAPGNPPSAHSGEIRDIFFALDLQARSVVTGPRGFGRAIVPKLLEEGGTVIAKGRSVRYEARPFMTPARDAMNAQLPNFWKDTLR